MPYSPKWSARHVRHDGDAGALRGESASQYSATRSLENRGFDARVAQHLARTDRPGVVAALDLFAAR